jgi:hypothetical protein
MVSVITKLFECDCDLPSRHQYDYSVDLYKMITLKNNRCIKKEKQVIYTCKNCGVCRAMEVGPRGMKSLEKYINKMYPVSTHVLDLIKN